MGGEQWFFGCHCLFKGTVRSHFPTEHGLGWRCSVFITQFLVLHDVKNFFFRTIQPKVSVLLGAPSLLLLVDAPGCPAPVLKEHMAPS